MWTAPNIKGSKLLVTLFHLHKGFFGSAGQHQCSCLAPSLVALINCTHYEGEIRFRCETKPEDGKPGLRKCQASNATHAV